MNQISIFRAGMLAVLTGLTVSLQAQELTTIKFSGMEWQVRQQASSGPGPNSWEASNARVDSKGWLHLKITKSGDSWTCAEVTSKKALGFGTYQFQVIGLIDKFDPNIVLGLFNYPTPEVGKDGTNEIDIEFAHWGNAAWPIGNYTVYPAIDGLKSTYKTFDFKLKSTSSTHRFVWESKQIRYQSLHGTEKNNTNEFQTWLLAPENRDKIPQKPLPVHMNLWLFQGHAPTDGNEVEVIVKSFKFTPAK